MSPERWKQIDAVFQAAAEMSPDRRAAFLTEQCSGDAELRREVESLLAFDAPDAGALTYAVADAQETMKAAEHIDVIGRRIGVYRITGVVGSGGMGTVYEAVRDDDVYEQRVAIKVVKRGMDTEFVRSRFRHERQILATLEHPRIARLLDGGTTDEGLPYLVMEFIEGVPITRYCRENNLPTAERLKLFAMVCSAVQYAHQKLIVHRDLKPSNILVTSEGVPKLLDFGIAKLINPDQTATQTELTNVASRMMTPDYASPEQVRGEAVTTTSDVYSLGAVLYEILTGQKPHQFRNRSSSEIERAICETETEKPSNVVRRVSESPGKLHRQLAGDLDNIVLMAMRKEADRRYSSVEQFSEDIRRHLEGMPVTARNDTIGYRTSKFLRRNRLAVVAASLIAVSLIGGVVATLHEARRAERRFQQVRKLANSFLFEIYGKIEHLPGSLPARQSMVKTALEYLDSLTAESGGDPGLRREIADAYIRVGDVQGHVSVSNLGNTEGAVASYAKALAMAQELVSEYPQDAAGQRTLAMSHMRMGDMLASRGNVKDGIRHYSDGIKVAQALATRHPESKQDLRQLGKLHRNVVTLKTRAMDLKGALENAREARGIYEELQSASPADAELKNELSAVYSSLGSLLLRSNDRAGALENYGKALTLRQEAVSADSHNESFKHDLMIAYGHIGDAYRSGNSTDETDRANALESYRKAMAIAEELSSHDPSDRRAQFDYGSALMRVGVAMPAGEAPGALLALKKSAEVMQKLSDADPKNARVKVNLAFIQLRSADRLLAMGQKAEAAKAFRAGVSQHEAVFAIEKAADHTVSLIRAYEHAARSLHDLGDPAAASDCAAKMVTVAEEFAVRHKDTIAALIWKPRAYAIVGGLHARWKAEDARMWMERSLSAWNSLKGHPSFTPNYQAELNRVAQQLQRGDPEVARAGVSR